MNLTTSRLERRGWRGPRATHLTFDGDHYLLELSIGSIWPRKYTVIIDTGSNGVFIGASKAQPFVPSRSTKTTVEPFQQAFIDRSRVTGKFVIDQMTLSDVSFKATFGAVEHSPSFDQPPYASGVLGLGAGTHQNYGTFMDQAFAAKAVTDNIVTLNLGSPSITFGALNTAFLVGTLVWTPRQDIAGMQLWGIKILVPEMLNWFAAGVIDSGTPTVAVPLEAFTEYQRRIPGSWISWRNRAIVLPDGVLPPPLELLVGMTEFVLTGEQQVFTSEQSPGTRFAFVTPLPKDAPQVIIWGAAFLQKFIIVLDKGQNKIGIGHRRTI